MDKTKDGEQNCDTEKVRFYETMNPLIIAGAIDVFIVVVLPDEFNPVWELIVGIMIIAAIVAYQYWRFSRGKKSKPVEIKEKEEPEPEPEPES